MKKSKLFVFAALLLSVCFTFNSCYDDVYGLINSEVVLEKLGINGNINKIVRVGDHSDFTASATGALFLCNGNIYYKTCASSSATGKMNGQWKKVNISNYVSDSSTNTFYITAFLASDSTNLYAMTYKFTENTTGYNTPTYVYVDKADITSGNYDNLTWTNLCSEPVSNTSYPPVKNLFDNQAVVQSNRNAYARVWNSTSNKYEVKPLSSSGFGTAVTSNGADENTASCVFFPKDNNDYFSPYYSMTANEKYIYFVGSRSYGTSEADSAYIFYADSWDSTNGYTNGGTTLSSIGLTSNCLSVAATSDALLLGTTTSGICKVALDSNKVPTGKTSFPTGNNGATIISSRIYCAFVLDPSANEGATDEYVTSRIYGTISSSSDTFRETGLYAYYPSRKNWNRDGTSDQQSLGN